MQTDNPQNMRRWAPRWGLGGVVMLLGVGWSLAIAATPPETRYDTLIAATALQYGLEPALVKALIKCESRFNPLAVSPRGAQGLMQLIPTTQTLLGVSNAFDPRDNIIAGVRYLAMLRETFGHDVTLVLAAYNAGPQAVIDADYAIPPFTETQGYVRCVLAARDVYRQRGFNEQVPTASWTPTQTADERDLVIGPLRLSHQVAWVGQRITVRLEARYEGPEVSHGVVLLTYPEALVSFIALHTSEHETLVRIPDPQTEPTPSRAWAQTAYQFLRGTWPAWQHGQPRTAVLALVPRVPQDLALHLSVQVYDAAKITVQRRWSAVVRLPVRARTW